MKKTLKQFEAVKQSVILDMELLSNVINKYDAMTNSELKLKLDEKQESVKSLSEIIDEQRQRISEGRFNILVLGEFSCGKSTFLNALIREKILPVSVRATTATINTISYAEEKKVLLKFWGPIDVNTGRELEDGVSKEIDIDELRSHTTSLTAEADEISKQIKLVEVSYPTEYCKNSVTIVDTPGFNSVHANHDTVTLNYLANGNAVIWLLNPLQPLTDSERGYLRKAKHHISKILFVVPKVDLLEDDQREDVWDMFKEDIPKETNMDAEVILYPVNAKLAANGDWESSKFQEFITELERFLWSDRKSKEMLLPGIVNSISIINSVKGNIDLILKGLAFSPEEFQNRIDTNLPHLERINKKQSEILQFIRDRRSLLLNRIDVEIPRVINSILMDVSSLILHWRLGLDALRSQLPDILKEKMMDISAKVEELVNEEILYIMGETNSRYEDFALETKTYQASVSQLEGDLSVADIDSYEGSLLDVAAIGGGNIGLGLLLGGVIASPLAWIAMFSGGVLFTGLLSEKLEEKLRNKQFIRIEKLVIEKFRAEFNSVTHKLSDSVRNILDDYARDVNSQIREVLNSIIEAIESIKKEQRAEKSKILQRVTQLQTLLAELIMIENSFGNSLKSLDNQEKI